MAGGGTGLRRRKPTPRFSQFMMTLSIAETFIDIESFEGTCYKATN